MHESTGIHLSSQMKKPLLIPFILAGLLAESSFAANYYRYKDENGVTVLGRSIPPHLVGNGYEILTDSGRVIEKVAPALTPEEIAARDAQLEAERLRKEAEEQQKKADIELLRLYSHPNEAAKIRDRKIQDLEISIKLKQTKISSLQTQIEEKQTHAANLERSGRSIPAAIIDSIATLNTEIGKIEVHIAAHEQDIEKTRNDFAKTILRLEQLTGKKDTVSEPEKAPESGYKLPLP